MKQFITLLLSLSIGLSAYCQDITGTWQGALKIGKQELRIVMHISETKEGLKSTMDSPDQGAKGIPVTSTTYIDGTLKMEIPNAQVVYSGKLNAAGVLEGTFKQAGKNLPLNLTKSSDEGIAARLQEPIKPYSYYSEDVSFENKEAAVTLAGTLTLPKKRGKFPVVVLISGSGPQDRDAQVFGHKPFLVLADHLTRQGIGVLRFDDRGTAASTGDFGSATSNDFATDVDAAVRYLQTRKEVAKGQIGLVGHSEGGLIAPIVAANNKDVAYIVLLAGPGIPGDELLLKQQELIAAASGASDQDILANKQKSMEMFEMIREIEDVELLQKKLKEYLHKQITDNPDAPLPNNMNADQYVNMQVAQISNPWMRNFLTYNPQENLAATTCPVLAINGEKDLQVPAEENLAAIKQTLLKAGNQQVTTRELKGMNHLFQECETGSPAEYSDIDETFSPIALNVISEWILKQVD